MQLNCKVSGAAEDFHENPESFLRPPCWVGQSFNFLINQSPRHMAALNERPHQPYYSFFF
jgi:hypothetical protein